MMWVIILIGIIILVVIGATIIFLHNRNHTTTAKKVKDIGELMNKYKNKQELTNADYRDIIVALYEDNLNNHRTTRNNLKRIRKLQDVATDTRLLATSNKDTIQKEKEIARANYDANKALIDTNKTLIVENEDTIQKEKDIARANYDANKALIDTNKTLIVENEDTIQKEKDIARANYDANKGLINNLNKQSNIHGRLITKNKSIAKMKHKNLKKRMNAIGDRVEGAASGLKKMTDFGVLDEINNLKGTIGDVETNKQSISKFEQSVGQLRSNVGQLRSNVGQIGTRVDQLESSTATKREVGDMQNSLTTTMNDAIAASYNDYKKLVDQSHSSLDNRFKSVETEIDNLGNNMDFAHSTDLNELKQTMDDISEEIGGYELSTLGELSQQVQKIQDERVDEEQRYSNLEDALNTHLHNRLDEQIGILQSNINNNAAAISNINQQNFIKQGDTIGGLLVTDNGPILSELLDEKANRSALDNYLTTDYGTSNDSNVTNMLGQLSGYDSRIASNTTNLSKIVNQTDLDGIDDGNTMYSLLNDRINSNSTYLDTQFGSLTEEQLGNIFNIANGASGTSVDSSKYQLLRDDVDSNIARLSNLSELLDEKANISALDNYLTTDYGTSNDSNVTNMLGQLSGYDSRIASNTTNLSKIVDQDELAGIDDGNTMYSLLDDRINSNYTLLNQHIQSRHTFSTVPTEQIETNINEPSRRLFGNDDNQLIKANEITQQQDDNECAILSLQNDVNFNEYTEKTGINITTNYVRDDHTGILNFRANTIVDRNGKINGDFLYNFKKKPFDMTLDYTISLWATGMMHIIVSDKFDNTISNSPNLHLIIKSWSEIYRNHDNRDRMRRIVSLSVHANKNRINYSSKNQLNIPYNELVHYCIVHNASKKEVEFYLNGEIITTLNYSDAENIVIPTSGYLTINSLYNGLYLGYPIDGRHNLIYPPWKFTHGSFNRNQKSITDIDGEVSNIFHQLMDVRICNNLAMTGEQITELYNDGLTKIRRIKNE
jgi:hypothetical protein